MSGKYRLILETNKNMVKSTLPKAQRAVVWHKNKFSIRSTFNLLYQQIDKRLQIYSYNSGQF